MGGQKRNPICIGINEKYALTFYTDMKCGAKYYKLQVVESMSALLLLLLLMQ